MKQFICALKDCRHRIIINILLSIQIFIMSIMISGITYQSYISFKNYSYLYKWNKDKDSVVFDVYINTQKPGSFEKSIYALQEVLSGGEYSSGFSFFIEDDNIYLFGNWQNINEFSTIPFLNINENEKKLDRNIDTILAGQSIYSTKDKNIYLSSSENLMENQHLINTKNFVQIVSNLNLFSPPEETVDSFVNQINENTIFLTIIPKKLEIKIDKMISDFCILIPPICFLFLTIIGVLCILDGTYKKKSREYAIHYVVGASESDILMRMFFLFNIISLPGVILTILIYNMGKFETIVFLQGLCIYAILFICSFIPSLIHFFKNTNKATFLRGD